MASNGTGGQNINVVIQAKGPRLGLVGLVVGFVGIFVFSIVLSPLAIILGIIAVLGGANYIGAFFNTIWFPWATYLTNGVGYFWNGCITDDSFS